MKSDVFSIGVLLLEEVVSGQRKCGQKKMSSK